MSTADLLQVHRCNQASLVLSIRLIIPLHPCKVDYWSIANNCLNNEEPLKRSTDWSLDSSPVVIDLEKVLFWRGRMVDPQNYNQRFWEGRKHMRELAVPCNKADPLIESSTIKSIHHNSGRSNADSRKKSMGHIAKRRQHSIESLFVNVQGAAHWSSNSIRWIFSVRRRSVLVRWPHFECARHIDKQRM